MKKQYHRGTYVLSRQNKSQKGFIALFFILGISFTFLTWVSLSSERVFEYINIKNIFTSNRSLVHNHMLCADAFINILIDSRYNLTFSGNVYNFKRSLYYSDEFLCQVKSISVVYQNNSIKTVFFIIADFGFEYQFKNGFINHIKSFNIF